MLPLFENSANTELKVSPCLIRRSFHFKATFTNYFIFRYPPKSCSGPSEARPRPKVPANNIRATSPDADEVEGDTACLTPCIS